MVYTSINNNIIKEIKKLQKKKYRDEYNKFIVEGEHLVSEAIKADAIDFVILEENYTFDTDKKVIKVTDKILKYLSNLDTPQKIMAAGLSVLSSYEPTQIRKIPSLRKFKGVAKVLLNPQDGVLAKTGGENHYTWWRTTSFDINSAEIVKQNEDA